MVSKLLLPGIGPKTQKTRSYTENQELWLNLSSFSIASLYLKGLSVFGSCMLPFKTLKSSSFFYKSSLTFDSIEMKISKNLTLGSKKLDIVIFVLDFLGKMLFNDQFFLNRFLFLFGFSFTTIHDSQHSRGSGAISLTPLYHFHPIHRHLDISREVTADSSRLHIANSRNRTGNLWFPNASR